MNLPTVAIVGRPNVGKSSLLNCLSGQKIGIVDPTAGVTRDRVSAVCQIGDVYFELVDTGGFGIEDHDNLTEHVETQIRYAIDQAHLVLFVVDAREGVAVLDQQVARLLRGHDCQVMLVANKVDTIQFEPMIGEFHRLGYGAALPLSAHHGVNRRALMARIAEILAPVAGAEPPKPKMRIAVVGKRNTGKSTFINALAGEQRVIVSEVAGTTRDAVDVTFEKDGQHFVVIDTAGVRKKNKMSGDIEFYSFVRAQRAIHRADVVLLFIDATISVGQVDKKLARFIAEHDKPCILVVNKWDLAKGRAGTDEYQEYLTKVLPEVSYAPISIMTAVEGRGTFETIDLARVLFKQALTRVPTAQINQTLSQVLAVRNATPRFGSRSVRVYYGTQVGISPPTVVLFVNRPELIRDEYRRFLLNRLRESLPFSEIPIRLVIRSHRQGHGGRSTDSKPGDGESRGREYV
jgi:GTP-binding protein